MTSLKVGGQTLATYTYQIGTGLLLTQTYDNQGQLISAAGDTTYTYTYDGAGNILTAYRRGLLRFICRFFV